MSGKPKPKADISLTALIITCGVALLMWAVIIKVIVDAIS